MNKSLIRFVAFLLIPALGVDPALASITPTTPSVFQLRVQNPVFTTQAINAATLWDMLPFHYPDVRQNRHAASTWVHQTIPELTSAHRSPRFKTLRYVFLFPLVLAATLSGPRSTRFIADLSAQAPPAVVVQINAFENLIHPDPQMTAQQSAQFKRMLRVLSWGLKLADREALTKKLSAAGGVNVTYKVISTPDSIYGLSLGERIPTLSIQANTVNNDALFLHALNLGLHCDLKNPDAQVTQALNEQKIATETQILINFGNRLVYQGLLNKPADPNAKPADQELLAQSREILDSINAVLVISPNFPEEFRRLVNNFVQNTQNFNPTLPTPLIPPISPAPPATPTRPAIVRPAQPLDTTRFNNTPQENTTSPYILYFASGLVVIFAVGSLIYLRRGFRENSVESSISNVRRKKDTESLPTLQPLHIDPENINHIQDYVQLRDLATRDRAGFIQHFRALFAQRQPNEYLRLRLAAYDSAEDAALTALGFTLQDSSSRDTAEAAYENYLAAHLREWLKLTLIDQITTRRSTRRIHIVLRSDPHRRYLGMPYSSIDLTYEPMTFSPKIVGYLDQYLMLKETGKTELLQALINANTQGLLNVHVDPVPAPLMYYLRRASDRDHFIEAIGVPEAESWIRAEDEQPATSLKRPAIAQSTFGTALATLTAVSFAFISSKASGFGIPMSLGFAIDIFGLVAIAYSIHYNFVKPRWEKDDAADSSARTVLHALLGLGGLAAGVHLISFLPEEAQFIPALVVLTAFSVMISLVASMLFFTGMFSILKRVSENMKTPTLSPINVSERRETSLRMLVMLILTVLPLLGFTQISTSPNTVVSLAVSLAWVASLIGITVVGRSKKISPIAPKNAFTQMLELERDWVRFAKQLTQLSLRRSSNMAEVASKAGMSTSTLLKIRNGISFPTPGQLKDLAAALKTRPSTLFPNHQAYFDAYYKPLLIKGLGLAVEERKGMFYTIPQEEWLIRYELLKTHGADAQAMAHELKITEKQLIAEFKTHPILGPQLLQIWQAHRTRLEGRILKVLTKDALPEPLQNALFAAIRSPFRKEGVQYTEYAALNTLEFLTLVLERHDWISQLTKSGYTQNELLAVRKTLTVFISKLKPAELQHYVEKKLEHKERVKRAVKSNAQPPTPPVPPAVLQQSPPSLGPQDVLQDIVDDSKPKLLLPVAAEPEKATTPDPKAVATVPSQTAVDIPTQRTTPSASRMTVKATAAAAQDRRMRADLDVAALIKTALLRIGMVKQEINEASLKALVSTINANQNVDLVGLYLENPDEARLIIARHFAPALPRRAAKNVPAEGIKTDAPDTTTTAAAADELLGTAPLATTIESIITLGQRTLHRGQKLWHRLTNREGSLATPEQQLEDARRHAESEGPMEPREPRKLDHDALRQEQIEAVQGISATDTPDPNAPLSGHLTPERIAEHQISVGIRRVGEEAERERLAALSVTPGPLTPVDVALRDLPGVKPHLADLLRTALGTIQDGHHSLEEAIGEVDPFLQDPEQAENADRINAVLHRLLNSAVGGSKTGETYQRPTDERRNRWRSDEGSTLFNHRTRRHPGFGKDSDDEPNLTQQLRSLLSPSNKPGVRHEAIKKFGTSGDATAVPILIAQLSRDGFNLRERAAFNRIAVLRALVRIKARYLDDRLMEERIRIAVLDVMEADPDSTVRLTAAQTLDRFGWKASLASPTDQAVYALAKSNWQMVLQLGRSAMSAIRDGIDTRNVTANDLPFIAVIGALGDQPALRGTALYILKRLSVSSRYTREDISTVTAAIKAQAIRLQIAQTAARKGQPKRDFLKTYFFGLTSLTGVTTYLFGSVIGGLVGLILFIGGVGVLTYLLIKTGNQLWNYTRSRYFYPHTEVLQRPVNAAA